MTGLLAPEHHLSLKPENIVNEPGVQKRNSVIQREAVTLKKRNESIKLKSNLRSSISEVALTTENVWAHCRAQGMVLFSWATERLLMLQITTQVSSSGVLPSFAVNHEVNVESLRLCIDASQTFSTDPNKNDACPCSQRFMSLLKFAKIVLKLRISYVNNDWSKMETCVKLLNMPSEVIEARTELFYKSLKEFSDEIATTLAINLQSMDSTICLSEILNCIWLIKHNNILLLLKEICCKTPFSDVNIESGDYSAISIGSKEANEIIKLAKEFILDAGWVRGVYEEHNLKFHTGGDLCYFQVNREFDLVLDLASKLIALRYLVIFISSGEGSVSLNVLQLAGLKSELPNQGDDALKFGLDLLQSISTHPGLKLASSFCLE